MTKAWIPKRIGSMTPHQKAVITYQHRHKLLGLCYQCPRKIWRSDMCRKHYAHRRQRVGSQRRYTTWTESRRAALTQLWLAGIKGRHIALALKTRVATVYVMRGRMSLPKRTHPARADDALRGRARGTGPRDREGTATRVLIPGGGFRGRGTSTPPQKNIHRGPIDNGILHSLL
mgnify:CR=1 FL=1